MVADYSGYSHEQLYKMVKAGRPEDVKNAAVIWKQLSDAADALARDLEKDLRKLGPGWRSSAGAEYEKRITAIVALSRDIARKSDDAKGRLENLAAHLHEAQQKIEDPAKTDDHDKTASYAAKGAAVGTAAGPVGTVAGGTAGAVVGWFADDDEKEKAKQRTVQLVTKLAGDYEAGSPGRIDPPKTPVDLPNGADSRTATPAGVSAGAAAAPIPFTKRGGDRRTVDHAPAPKEPERPGTTNPGGYDGSGDPPTAGGSTHNPPSTGTGDAGGQESPGSGLAGAGEGGLTGIGTGGGGLYGTGAAGASPTGTGLSGAGPAGAGAVAAGRPGGASSPGSGAGNPRSIAPNSLGRSGRAGKGGFGGRGLMGGGNGEDEADERLTWLTEDEMVWGDDEVAAPAILGRPESGEPDDDRGA